jgi:hypothetical protein
MRALLPALLLLAGCAEAILPVAAANTGVLVVTGRTAPDLVVSLATGRDCSIAHVETEGVYCRRRAGAQAEPPACTRSIGAVDCWRALPEAAPPYRVTADGPPPAAEAPRWPEALVP